MAKLAKRYHPSFKFKVVLESFIKGNVSAVGRHYEVNPNQLSTWRRELIEKGELLFSSGKTNQEKKLKSQLESLENLIGKKEIEINLLKKYLDFYAPPDGA